MTQTATTEPTQTTEAPKPAPPRAFSRADYLAATAVRYGRYTHEDGRVSYFRSLSHTEQAEFDHLFFDPVTGEPDEKRWRTERTPRLLALVLTDDQGQRLFEDDEWPELGRIDDRVMGPVLKAVAKHLGQGRTDGAEAAKKG